MSWLFERKVSLPLLSFLRALQLFVVFRRPRRLGFRCSEWLQCQYSLVQRRQSIGDRDRSTSDEETKLDAEQSDQYVSSRRCWKVFLDGIQFADWMYGGHDRLCSKPVGENDFKKFLDTDGRLVHANELRQAIYEGGIEPSFRKVVWRHLLNIFPSHMKSFERIEYLNEVSRSYDK